MLWILRVKTISHLSHYLAKIEILPSETCRHSNVSHEIDCPEPDIKSILLRSSIYCFTIYLPPLPHCLDLLFPLGALRFSPFCTHCYTHPLIPRCGCRVDVPAEKTVLRLSITSSTDTQLAPLSNRFCNSANRTTCTNTVHEQHPHLLMNNRLFASLHNVHVWNSQGTTHQMYVN